MSQGIHAREVHKELQPMGRPHIEEAQGGLSPMGGTPRWSRGSKDSLAAHGVDHEEAAVPLQSMED